MATQPAPPIRTWRNAQSLRGLHAYLPTTLLDGILVFNLFLVAIFFSRTFEFFPGGKSLVNTYMFASNAIFLVLAVMLHPTARNFIIAMATFIFIELMVFVLHFGLKFYAASLASFPGLFSCGLIAIYARQYPLDRAMRMIFAACFAYALTFLHFHYSIDAYQLAVARSHGLETGSSIMIAHGVEGTSVSDAAFRIAVSAIHLAFGFFYALEQYRARRSTTWLGITLFFGFCIAICDFRFMMAAILLTAVISFIPLSRATKLKAGMGFILVTLIGSAVLAIFSFNIYGVLQSDATGLVRYYEAEIAFDFIHAYPLLGTGLYGTADDLASVYGNSILAPSDIGYLGEFLQFGMLGLLLLLLCNMLVYRFVKSAGGRPDSDIVIGRTLTSLFLFVAIMQTTSTFLWEEGGALILALSIGYASRSVLSRRPRVRAAAARVPAGTKA
ncbi:hypothetical protein HZF05_17860 [Sphingomonas sp. CGMCC 1.13654]|uniref:O-antigen ligase domain-containing protein n=1 Tax=Sphingomonas chungangi TaxID=2683589 RepID=A0A838LBI6_9SPHN|nr:hypothetical protein [Sphingomonas chungangi]MBA2935949.1 hypothetical protein [Sphingomonas chungangi]MVW55339.1 hypothetical protein [Sphingomonas chungangi]